MKVLDRKEKMKVNVDVVKDQLDKTLMGAYRIYYSVSLLIFICRLVWKNDLLLILLL